MIYKIYKKNFGLYVFTSFATMCLAPFLLIPFLNNHILNVVIKQETGINTRYYYRPLNHKVRNSKRSRPGEEK